MKQILFLSLLTCLITLNLACVKQENSYTKEILDWQKERLANLVKEDGWATLAGLFPLKEGSQSFGSAKDNQLLYPDFAPDTIGTFIVKGDSAWMEIKERIAVKNHNQIISKVSLAPLETSEVYTLDRLQWFIIQRGDRFLVRLRDSQHPARDALTHIPYYPIDLSWRLEATFHAYDTVKILPLPNALDMVVENESPGYLSFEYAGQTYSLQALEEGPELFLLFYDETSGVETYGGGRYLYTAKPLNGQTTTLDFNKAYSPPCAFTEYATCLLPPSENRLPLLIEAGEKDPHFLTH